jgi:hypothetical protein
MPKTRRLAGRSHDRVLQLHRKVLQSGLPDFHARTAFAYRLRTGASPEDRNENATTQADKLSTKAGQSHLLSDRLCNRRLEGVLLPKCA